MADLCVAIFGMQCDEATALKLERQIREFSHVILDTTNLMVTIEISSSPQFVFNNGTLVKNADTRSVVVQLVHSAGDQQILQSTMKVVSAILKSYDKQKVIRGCVIDSTHIEYYLDGITTGMRGDRLTGS